MREILFRGKRKDNGEWETGFLIGRYDPIQKENVIKSAYIDNGTCFYAPVEVIPETVGQYTGLTDKNGKRIFDGDIVKHYHDRQFPESYSKGVIFYDKEHLRWKRTTSQNVNCCIANDCIYEVIGNIHENPELMKK